MEFFPQKLKGQIPFKNGLVESKISGVHRGRGKLYEFENDPNKIIRVISFDSLRKIYHNQIDPVSLAGLGKKLYKELETTYDIPVPVEYIAGRDAQRKDVIYGITEKITGENLVRINVTPEIASQVEKLYTSLSQYYINKFSKLPDGEIYLADISGASQYVYGTKTDDDQSRMYLVDTDLFMRNGKAAFYYVITEFIRDMISVERKFDKQFDDARKNIEQILLNSSLEGLSSEETEKIKKAVIKARDFLDGRFSKESGAFPTDV